MDRTSDQERQRIAELIAQGATAWQLQQEIHRSRYAIRLAVIALQRQSPKQRTRSALRLSLVEREEISRGTHWFRLVDGKIVEHWANRDDQGQALQLGWVPPSPIYLLRMAIALRRARRDHRDATTTS